MPTIDPIVSAPPSRHGSISSTAPSFGSGASSPTLVPSLAVRTPGSPTLVGSDFDARSVRTKPIAPLDAAPTSTSSWWRDAFNEASHDTLFGHNAAHRTIGAVVSGLLLFAAKLGETLNHPAAGLCAVVTGAAVGALAPALGLIEGRDGRERAPQKSGVLRRMEPLLCAALLLAANLRWGGAMAAAGFGTQMIGHTAIGALPLRQASLGHRAAMQAVWVSSEMARIGAAVGAESFWRALSLPAIERDRAATDAMWLEAKACNSLGASCLAPLGQIAFPGTHLSFTAELSFWPLRNQWASVERQFADGIRLFLLEYIVDDHGRLRNTHAGRWDLGSMQSAFARINALLVQNPNELVVLKLSNQATHPQNTSEALLLDAFDKSGLLAKAFGHGGYVATSLGDMLASPYRAMVVYDGDLAQSTFSAWTPQRIVASMDSEWAPPFGKKPTLINAFTTFTTSLTSLTTNEWLPVFWQHASQALATQNQSVHLVAVNDYQSSRVVELARQHNLHALPMYASSTTAGTAQR